MAWFKAAQGLASHDNILDKSPFLMVESFLKSKMVCLSIVVVVLQLHDEVWDEIGLKFSVKH